MTGGPFTLVSFHAHPDDESLLTGGTLARAAAEGHRVVLVVATGGELGLAARSDGTGTTLAGMRLAELHEAARRLGVHRVVELGYADSGLHAENPSDRAFAHADLDDAARRLGEVLLEERAEVLTTYDANGGYGHPDHVQAHRVAVRAAALADTPVVLEATVPGDLYRRVLAVLRLLGSVIGRSAPLGTTNVFSDSGALTHRVVVGPHLAAKRAALRAHASQGRGGDGPRVLTWILNLPSPIFALAFGREWFVERGRAPGGREGDVFASLRT